VEDPKEGGCYPVEGEGRYSGGPWGLGGLYPGKEESSLGEEVSAFVDPAIWGRYLEDPEGEEHVAVEVPGGWGRYLEDPEGGGLYPGWDPGEEETFSWKDPGEGVSAFVDPAVWGC
jgi:hypothetical protein